MLKRNQLCFFIIVVSMLMLNLTTGCHMFQNGKAEKKKDAQSLARLQELIESKNAGEALQLFKSLELRLTSGIGLYKSWLFFALYGQDAGIRQEYGKKFLNARDMTKELAMRKGEVFRSFARDAINAGDLSGAREMLEEGVSVASDNTLKALMEMELSQLDLLGKPAPPLTVDRWLNAPAGGTFEEGFNGKPVLLVFRAPWCEKSRSLTGLLKEVSRKYGEQGVSIVEVMKLYGTYQDDKTTPQRVSPEEELRLVGQYVERQGIQYPVAISTEGLPFDVYRVSVLPALFFIDSKGTIAGIATGSGSQERIRERIKHLMEEK